MRRDDAAVSNVVGAILVFAVVGLAVLSINALYVPKQGATLEVAARETAEDALVTSAALQSSSTTPFLSQIPLSPSAGAPSLLPGIILDPVRPDGLATLNASATRIAISYDVGGTRYYALGNATSGAPVGALTLRIGGAYLDSATYQASAGAVLLMRGNQSAMVAPPALHVARGGSAASPITEFSWRVPVLAGGLQQVAGKGAAQARFVPGPLAQAGGGQLVGSVTVVVTTDAVEAWNTTLRELVGANGVVTVGAGNVTATILPPAGTPAGARAVSLDLSLVRFEVALTSRSA